MGRLIDGEWYTDAELQEKEDTGEFQREETTFRDWIEADPDAEFQPEAGRYHLYVSLACPWAHRTLITRKLKGLEDAVSVSVVDPVRIDQGWEFAPEKSGCTEEPIFGAEYLREVYVAADPDYTGRVSVPVLWDTERETIVNNESAEIMRMFDTAFDGVATRDVDLYPEGYRERVDETIEAIYQPINNGVYRAGFAGTQDAYDEAVTELFDALDHWEAVLADRRYLCGPVLTEADVAMFTTLFRFDPVYHTHFKCNVRRLRDYENLWNYAKDIYGTDGVAETCNLDHVKTHYHRSHASLNPRRIIPKGPEIDYDEPHDRDRLDCGPPEVLLAGDAALD
jgi:putative glutathione S-transferase